MIYFCMRSTLCETCRCRSKKRGVAALRTQPRRPTPFQLVQLAMQKGVLSEDTLAKQIFESADSACEDQMISMQLSINGFRILKQRNA